MDVDIDTVRRSGKLLSRLLRKAYDLLESGERCGLKIANALEAEAWEHAAPAFPCNVGPDQVAAHLSPTDAEPADIRSARLVKIDFGVHVDGWISDAAFTYVFDENCNRVARAAYDALYEAVHVIRPGTCVAEIGKKISDVAKRHGVKPVSNLGGHQIHRYMLHAGLFVPNVPEGRGVVDEGMLLAVEPFMTDGRGHVSEGTSVTIYSLERRRARSQNARKMLEYIENRFKTLPFARRWIEKEFGKGGWLALYELVKGGSLRQYPILLEDRGSVVAQFETTVYVDKDGAEVIVDVFELGEW